MSLSLSSRECWRFVVGDVGECRASLIFCVANSRSFIYPFAFAAAFSCVDWAGLG